MARPFQLDDIFGPEGEIFEFPSCDLPGNQPVIGKSVARLASEGRSEAPLAWNHPVADPNIHSGEDDQSDGDVLDVVGDIGGGTDLYATVGLTPTEDGIYNAGKPEGSPGTGGGGAGGGGNGGGGSGGGDSGGTGETPVLTSYLSDNGGDGSDPDGPGNGLDGFDIFIDFSGKGWTAEIQQAFINAANYLTTVITSDLYAVVGGEIDSEAGDGRGTVWDDLFIDASLGRIDGGGGVLAQAAVAATWPSGSEPSNLPAYAVMKIDSFDLDYLTSDPDLLQAVVTHEMFHAAGFGGLWDQLSLLNASGDYTGAAGMSAYQLEFHNSDSSIPVEDGGGSGTAGAHWDEDLFEGGTAELMTGYLDPDSYLSYTSVMSLEDLGYDVAYADYAYDDYVYDGLMIG